MIEQIIKTRELLDNETAHIVGQGLIALISRIYGTFDVSCITSSEWQILQTNKIEAIRLVKNRTGLSLSRAKALVDQYT